MKRLFLAAAMAVTAAGPAAAEEDVAVIQAPSWIHRPEGPDMARTYPGGRDSAAVIRCSVNEAGKLETCEVLSESRPGVGKAALKLAPRFQMRPTTPDGRSVKGGVVTIPIRWSMN